MVGHVCNPSASALKLEFEHQPKSITFHTLVKKDCENHFNINT